MVRVILGDEDVILVDEDALEEAAEDILDGFVDELDGVNGPSENDDDSEEGANDFSDEVMPGVMGRAELPIDLDPDEGIHSPPRRRARH